MNKAILIINANLATAQAIKHNLTSPNTEIVCVSSMNLSAVDISKLKRSRTQVIASAFLFELKQLVR